MHTSHFYKINTLSPKERASIVSLVRIFVKKNTSFDENVLYNDFIEATEYYANLGYSDYVQIKTSLNDDYFIKDIKLLIRKYAQNKKYKEQQKPYIEKQKKFLKNLKIEKLKKQQSKEKPTKKQIDYYNFLCKLNNTEPENLQNKSKLDLIEMINDILKNKK